MTASPISSTRRSHRRGSTIVETALVLFFVLLPLSFGTIEYSYAFFVKNAMQAAARETVRRAILPSCTTTADAEAFGKALLKGSFGDARAAQFTFQWTGTPGAASGGEIKLKLIAPAWSAFNVRPLGNTPLWGSVAPAANRKFETVAVMYKE